MNSSRPGSAGPSCGSVEAGGWSGAHKWADRGWLEAREAELGEAVPLLVGDDGAVLEAARANVFAVFDGALATPPVDGRILPGTGRAATLALAAELGIAAVERPLTLDDLHASRRGLPHLLGPRHPPRPLPRRARQLPGHATTDRLAAALRERWLGRRRLGRARRRRGSACLARFASYIAASAAAARSARATSSPAGASAMPTLSESSKGSSVAAFRSASAASIRATAPAACSASAPARIAQNSSPPRRAITSEPRSTDSSTPAVSTQRPVAGVVAVTVVDRLHVVEVGVEDRHRQLQPPRRRQQPLAEHLEAAAVGEAGQLVADRQRERGDLGFGHRRQFAQRLLVELARVARGVVEDAEGADRLAPGRGDRLAGVEADVRVGEHGRVVGEALVIAGVADDGRLRVEDRVGAEARARVPFPRRRIPART